MDEKNAEKEKIILPSESEDEDSKEFREPCASSYLVEERESSKKSLPQKFRKRWTRAALSLAIISLIAVIALSLASFISSKQTESSAVFAAGFDAFFAAVNVVAVCWRFRDELNGDVGSSRESKATCVIAVTFILGGVATVGISLHHLKIKDHPTKTGEMIILLITGFVIYTVLCIFQCRIASAMQSQSMRALSVDSGLGAVMNAGLLGSSWIYRQHTNLWYLDHAVATVLGVVSTVYGIYLAIQIIQVKINGAKSISFKREGLSSDQNN
ncbi:unnamed protein product [Porites evermanni]|uniref:Transmembrane protein 163 n=1 Tax=Porites evermanni TaxID=104178 RepID=A0ABN8M0B2_9CNID|nr:unnamed protein product [Porites evermanni]